MISVEKAKALLLQHCPQPEMENTFLGNACGRILASDIIAPVNLPPFDQSAMDGFALFAILKKNRKKMVSRILYRVSGEIKAGSICKRNLDKGEVFRIFTGAKIPAGANCVVKQEDVKPMTLKDAILVPQGQIRKGAHIRCKGSQIANGDVALKKHTILNPAAIGFLAAMGINKARVFKSPAVSIIATGNELAAPGKQLRDGKIYESNIAAIAAALRQIHIKPAQSLRVADRTETLKDAIKNAIRKSDLLIICGGVSVGKYDLVQRVCMECGIREIFHGIDQKPGKPLFFGNFHDKLVFGLPGNPAAALICFYEYIFPVIRRMQGVRRCFLPKVFLKSAVHVSKKDQKARFLKSKITGHSVRPLNGQESNIMRSFANSDSFIYVHKDKKSVKKNELVEVHPLPWYCDWDGTALIGKNR